LLLKKFSLKLCCQSELGLVCRTFDAVNKRELELGAATMTSLIYMMDNYIQKPGKLMTLPIKE
jgi:hypothetical protein